MRILQALIILLSFPAVWAASHPACPRDRSDYFCLSPDMAPDSLIQKNDFYRISQTVVELFRSDLEKLGAPVSLDAQWESPFMGAGISHYQDVFRIMILGGTARVEGMTPDAFAALACHELGHLLGGEPRNQREDTHWASLEGQADYWAASVCMPRYLASMGLSRVEEEQRIEAAGFHLFGSLKDHSTQTRHENLQRGKQPLPAVQETLQGYPSVQCRYETFRDPSQRSSCWYAGSL